MTGRQIPAEEVERRPGRSSRPLRRQLEDPARSLGWAPEYTDAERSWRRPGGGTLASGACRPSRLLPLTEAVDESPRPRLRLVLPPCVRAPPHRQLPARYDGRTMVGRAMRLVLCLRLAVCAGRVIGIDRRPARAGRRLAAGRRISTTMFAKYEALSICVQAVTGEQHEAELGRDLVAASLEGLACQGRPLTVPAAVDVGCPRDPAHFGANVKSRRVARKQRRRSPDAEPVSPARLPDAADDPLGTRPGAGPGRSADGGRGVHRRGQRR